MTEIRIVAYFEKNDNELINGIIVFRILFIFICISQAKMTTSWRIYLTIKMNPIM